jgi:CheY-like chemotaxis protein/Ran GTPase-activating protein (RanGAP) involved in mRNA processing and transport
MTSAYDAVYDEDLPGFLCVKTQFWDKGQPDVEVFVRRRTIEGDWIWLVSKCVSYVNQQIPGIILEESLVADEDYAKKMNRIIRITAILVQAVEAAQLTQAKPAPEANPEGEGSFEPTPFPTETDEATTYQALMANISATGVHVPDSGDVMQNLMQTVASNGAANGGSNGNQEKNLEQEIMENVNGGQKKTFDPFLMMESVRKGVRLDLGLTTLSPPEVKMITLVLSGKLQVDQVCPLVLAVVRSGEDIRSVLRKFSLDSDKVSPRHSLPNPNPLNLQLLKPLPPPISVVNLSYSYIGNTGVEMLSEILYCDGSVLKTIDISFCKIEERGVLALARALVKRKRKGIAPLQGILLSGNYISVRAATELGVALSPADRETSRSRKRSRGPSNTRAGYDSDSGESDEEEDEDEDFGSAKSKKKNRKPSRPKSEVGLQVLHVASASMTSEAIGRLLQGLGASSAIRELNLSSNGFGAEGAGEFVKFLEGRQRSRDSPIAMPFLDRLDMSNNNLGDDGTTQLTRAISKRSSAHFVDLKLSSNNIGAGGVETIMNKLLQHNLVSLSLDKNAIGDQGCQLVAASLQTMKALSRLNLSFNQIGSRGINSLMRSLIACESITYLGLSGNILRISGAIALAFTLAQHPRLEELDLDNCCLGQAAQCHISAGIISNRWVPMKRLKGYAVGPPMVAIGALKPYAQNLSNEECFRIRKDEQMKTILQWMESNRLAKKMGGGVDPNLIAAVTNDPQNPRFLTPDFVSSINDVQGTPSQNAYFRLLGWLSHIPFDDDELTALQKYFYDADGGEGDRGSDGYINLKLRGDLLAALDSEVADEIRDEFPSLASSLKGSIGMDLDKLYRCTEWVAWEAFLGNIADPPPGESDSDRANGSQEVLEEYPANGEEEEEELQQQTEVMTENTNDIGSFQNGNTSDSQQPGGIPHSESTVSTSGRGRMGGKVKPRITMFPQFEQQLEELKATATEMIEHEEDPMQHEVILTQYAEASLTILRQLRYHCMNSGLDGWRQGGLKRKVLIVDDSTVTRKLVSRAFEKANFIVDTAKNGAEGVERMKASIYDIAFMDIDMPVMNGFEATKKLRDWEDKMRPGARQPICALTAAYVDDFERSELMKFKEAGLDVMESKPCNIPRLFKVVDDVSPMFSDLSISVIQRERSDSRLSERSTSTAG